MKRTVLLLIVCLITALVVVSCTPQSLGDDGKTTIVCTTFAQYDWAKNIVKGSENVSLVLLNTKGTDMHSFEPSADDIITVTGSDILIVVGGEADKWATDALAKDSKTTVINLLELANSDETALSHKHTESCEHSQTHLSDSSDEHIWMSIKNAMLFTGEICRTISEKDKENASLYKANSENYVNLLSGLDEEFTKAVSSSSKPVMVVADRFPFVYLANDYGIECIAAFPGCSADTDASPETVIRLAEAINEHGLHFVAITENTSGKTAKAVIDNTYDKNQQTVVIDSMQAVSVKDIENGASYVSIMEKNLDAVKTLLETK